MLTLAAGVTPLMTGNAVGTNVVVASFFTVGVSIRAGLGIAAMAPTM